VYFAIAFFGAAATSAIWDLKHCSRMQVQMKGVFA